MSEHPLQCHFEAFQAIEPLAGKVRFLEQLEPMVAGFDVKVDTLIAVWSAKVRAAVHREALTERRVA